jgi:hypothetical protein
MFTGIYYLFADGVIKEKMLVALWMFDTVIEVSGIIFTIMAIFKR